MVMLVLMLMLQFILRLMHYYIYMCVQVCRHAALLPPSLFSFSPSEYVSSLICIKFKKGQSSFIRLHFRTWEGRSRIRKNQTSHWSMGSDGNGGNIIIIIIIIVVVVIFVAVIARVTTAAVGSKCSTWIYKYLCLCIYLLWLYEYFGTQWICTWYRSYCCCCSYPSCVVYECGIQHGILPSARIRRATDL